MSFEKPKISYVFFGVHMLLACTLFFVVFHRALDFTALENPYWQTALVCFVFFLAAALFVPVRRLAERKKEWRTARGGLLAEGIVVVLLLAAGVLLRRNMLLRTIFLYAGPWDGTYFELAKVDGEGIPLLSYGTQYVYVALLRALFFVVGNHAFAGVALQIVLQTVAALIWYLAVRRLSGRTTGIVVLAVLMLMPAAVREALIYSPRMLHFLLLGIGLLLAGRLLKQQKGTQRGWCFWFWTAVFGGMAGVLTYLDPVGLLLLIPVCFLAVTEGHHKLLRQWLVLLGVFLLTLAGCFLLDAWLSGADLLRVFGTWLHACEPKAPVWAELVFLRDNTGMELFLQAGLAFLILLGIPAFFCRRRKEGQTLWILLTMGLAAVCLFRTDYVKERYAFLLLVLFAVLAGSALEALFAVEPETETAKAAETKPEAETAKNAEAGPEMVTTAEPGQEKPKEADKTAQPEAVAAMGEIRFIENPLPLPKKHVKKTMGYRQEIPLENMHYDIEVPDTDDFDL